MGLYLCNNGPWASVPIAILPGGKYLGPYYDRESTPGNYRLVNDKTIDPGGQVFEYADGPYADRATWRNEYYPKGSSGYDVPVIYAVVLPTATSRGVYTRCFWTRSNPW